MTQDETMQLLSKLSTMDTSNTWTSSPVDLSLSHHSTDQITSSARSTSSTPPSTSSVFGSRKQREFTPDSKKDESYWDRRRRNNEAAKRSREKRRISDVLLEQRVLDLTHENQILRSELFALKEKFGIPLNHHIIDPNAVTLPLPENNLRGRRNKLLSAVISANIFTPSINECSNGGDKGSPMTLDEADESSDAVDRKKCRRSSKEECDEGLNRSLLASYVSASSPLSSSSSLSDLAVGCSSENNHASQSTSPTYSVSSSPLASTVVCGAPSLPHKLRHKAATRYTCNEVEPPNDGPVNSVSDHQSRASPPCTSSSSQPSSPQVTVRSGARTTTAPSPSHSVTSNNSNSITSCATRQGYSSVVSDIITPHPASSHPLKEQNYTLTEQLARLACEVASLKTILTPSTISPGTLVSHVCPPGDKSLRSSSRTSPVNTDQQLTGDVYVKKEITVTLGTTSTCDSSSEENNCN